MPSRFAIILAGGAGTRMGIGIPKQFLSVAGKPIIIHTLDTFQNHDAIDRIIIVSHPDYIEQTGRLVGEHRITKVDGIIAGGDTRQQSSYNALLSRSFGDDDILIFHDAVRPFISGETIDECIRETETHGAVDVCVPTTDTIVQSDADGFVDGMPERSVLRNGQTPQAFVYRVIRDAHEKARKSSFTRTTDDVRLVINAGHKVRIVKGSYENIKITNANDMILAEAIATNRRSVRVFPSKKLVLRKPSEFSEVTEERELFDKNAVAVRPSVASICQADLRYYLGKRRPEVLAKKLPMVLLHEGVGIIEDANDNPNFEKGDRVIIVPNVPGCVYDPLLYNTLTSACSFCGANFLYENHCKYVRFLSSGHDGLAQSVLLHPTKCLLRIDDSIPDDIATMSELLTVSYNAIKRVILKRTSDIVIFGDGPLGYLTAVVIHRIFNFDRRQIHVIGIDNLDKFDFATVHRFDDTGISSLHPDFVFECVGGEASATVINRAIEMINPAGKIVLMGVSEENIGVNTRDILEKGITITGSSRSSRYDYADIYASLANPELQSLVRRLVLPKRFIVRGAADLTAAFEYAAHKSDWGKVFVDLDLS